MAVAGRSIVSSNFEAETATGLSAMVGEGVNHGSVTRFLSGKDYTAKGHGRQHGQAGRECRWRADLWRSHSGKGMDRRERIDLLAWRPLHRPCGARPQPADRAVPRQRSLDSCCIKLRMMVYSKEMAGFPTKVARQCPPQCLRTAEANAGGTIAPRNIS